MLEQLKASESYEGKTALQKGFTLIELLVVIVILGILAAVVVFAVSGINDRGEDSAAEIECRTVKVAQEAHYAQEGSYAASTAALATAGFLESGTTGYNTTTDNTGAVSGDGC